jgi:hypothetical protein
MSIYSLILSFICISSIQLNSSAGRGQLIFGNYAIAQRYADNNDTMAVARQRHVNNRGIALSVRSEPRLYKEEQLR